MTPWAPLHAQPQEVSTTFKVSARVEAVCDMSATDLALSAFTAQSRAPQLRAICTPDTTYYVGLNKGSARSPVSGNTIGNDSIFGGVPAAKVVPAGDHADAITVRVYY